jgi:hypothetical protein
MPVYTRQYGYEPYIDEEDVEMLLGGNAARLLKIEPPIVDLPKV